MLSEESQPGTILVVDGDTAWLANLERWLAADGFRVIGMPRGEWVVQADWTSSGSCVGDNPTFPSSS